MTPRVSKGGATAHILTTQEVRNQVKIIAALTGSTMKDVIARLVAEEMKRIAPAVKP